tara:strand:+ start:740 stop:949 length:210 start_codon:yes stop_codon:yes gene_type:complete
LFLRQKRLPQKTTNYKAAAYGGVISRSYKLSRLDEALKGFCWGLGFAISSVLVYVAFLMYAHAGILYKN